MSDSTPPSPPPAPAGPGGGGLVYPANPPKDPVLILILNLVFGIGYIMMGQKTKGIVAIGAFWVVTFATCGPGSIIAALYAIDGYLQAQQLQQGHPVGEWTFFNDHR